MLALSTEERNKLIVDHIHHAEDISKRMYQKKAASCVHYDEIRSAAYDGLIDAANKCEDVNTFKQYCQFRIRGSIMDCLREHTPKVGKRTLSKRSLDVMVFSMKSRNPAPLEESLSEYDTVDFETKDFYVELLKPLDVETKKIFILHYMLKLTTDEIFNMTGIAKPKISKALIDGHCMLNNYWRKDKHYLWSMIPSKPSTESLKVQGSNLKMKEAA